MKKLFTLLFLSIILKTFANGGPIDGSVFYKTGDIVLMKYADIKLIKENLKIKLDGDYSLVTVNYILENKSSYKKGITYGFPIELLANSHWGEEGEDFLIDIKFSMNENALPLKSQTDLSEFKSEVKDFKENEVSVKRRWYVVEFSIEKEEIIQLAVSYKVKNSFIDWATSKSFFENYDERKFIYDFTPAHKWGNGSVESMNIEVDASKIIAHGGKVNVKGLSLSKNKGIYNLTKNNFDLKNALPLYISYENKSEKFSEYVLKHKIPEKHIKKVKVSSKLKGDYGKENLFDTNFNTAWAEGKKGAGIGEKIEIEFDNYNLAAICLINGYSKNAEVFKKNNRLKKIKVKIDYVDYYDKEKTKVINKEFTFEDKKYEQINSRNFYHLSAIIGDYGEAIFKMRKITITILEVYRGTTYNDTCISELFLLGYK